MVEVTTPRGEDLKIYRRWFPWPHITTEKQFEEWGFSGGAADFLSKGKNGDFLISFIVLLPLLLIFVTSPFSLLFFAILFLYVGALATCYLALPWSVEVQHDGVIIESESSQGYSVTTARIAKIANLYENGIIILPTPPPVKPVSDLPKGPETKLPEPPNRIFQNVEDSESVFAIPEESLETILESAHGEDSAKPTGPQIEFDPNDTPLRRAIKMMEAEDEELRSKGVVRSEKDFKEVKRARVTQKGKSVDS